MCCRVQDAPLLRPEHPLHRAFVITSKLALPVLLRGPCLSLLRNRQGNGYTCCHPRFKTT